MARSRSWRFDVLDHSDIRRDGYGTVNRVKDYFRPVVEDTLTVKRVSLTFALMIHSVFALLGVLTVLLIYWQWAPYDPRFEMVESSVLTPVVISGGTLGIHRKFKVLEPGGTADVDREVRSSDGKISAFLPSTGRFYEAREYETTTYSILPALPPGDYEFRLVVEYKVNPIRKERFQPPNIRFRVVL